MSPIFGLLTRFTDRHVENSTSFRYSGWELDQKLYYDSFLSTMRNRDPQCDWRAGPQVYSSADGGYRFNRIIMPPVLGKVISVAFVRLSVCPSVAYIANSTTQRRRSVPTFDATLIAVSGSNGQRSGLEAGGGIPCGPNPAATLLVSHFVRTLVVEPIIFCS